MLILNQYKYTLSCCSHSHTCTQKLTHLCIYTYINTYTRTPRTCIQSHIMHWHFLMFAFTHTGEVENGGSWDFAAEPVNSRCSERPSLKSIRESN